MRCFLILLCGLSCLAPYGKSQTQPTLANLSHSWMSTRINPAQWPTKKGVGLLIQLPAFGTQTWFEGPTYGDFVSKQGGQRVLTINHAIAQMQPQNMLLQQTDIPLLAAAMTTPIVAAGISSQLRLHAFGSYPRTLPQLIWQGNSQFVGQTVELDHQVEFFSFHEWAAWGTVRLGHLSVGTRLKWLNGIQALRTTRNHLSLTTNEIDYAITIETDYEILSAGSFSYQSLQDFTINLPSASLSNLQLFSRNGGFAIDLGISYQTKQLELNASIIDWKGTINWQTQATAYTTQGSRTWQGVDISAALTGDSVMLGNALDTLRQLLELQPQARNFQTQLPSQYYLSGYFHLNQLVRIGVVWAASQLQGRSFHTWSLQGRMKLGQLVQVGAALNIRNQGQPVTIGLSATAKLGPTQVVAFVDNATALWAPAQARFFQARIAAQVQLNK